MPTEKFDIGVELKLLSLETKIPLESLALQYWGVMKQLGSIEDPKSRNVYAIVCLEEAYFPKQMMDEYD